MLLTGVALVSGCVAVSPETTRTRGDGPARMSATGGDGEPARRL